MNTRAAERGQRTVEFPGRSTSSLLTGKLCERASSHSAVGVKWELSLRSSVCCGPLIAARSTTSRVPGACVGGNPTCRDSEAFQITPPPARSPPVTSPWRQTRTLEPVDPCHELGSVGTHVEGVGGRRWPRPAGFKRFHRSPVPRQAFRRAEAGHASGTRKMGETEATNVNIADERPQRSDADVYRFPLFHASKNETRLMGGASGR